MLESTQLVPQGKKPAWHANEHSESRQTGLPWGGALQVVPHDRQFFSSSFSTTQAPLQTVSPSRQTRLLLLPELPPSASMLPGRTQILSALQT